LENLDLQILTFFKESPDKAFSMMYDEYYTYLVRQAYRLLQDEVVAEDVVQTVFIGLWNKKETLDINISLKQYLRRSTINHSLNHIRKTKKLRDDVDKIDDLQIASAEDHSINIEVEELNERIGKAIETLPERCRLVFSMSRFEEMTYREIAEDLDISIKTVENQITKALKLMRDILNKKI
jgi:RNA polymerase sigma-70 factor (ECF subfamily)